MTIIFFLIILLLSTNAKAQPMPRANAGEDRSACVNEPVLFDVRSSVKSETDFFYEWDFGDYLTDRGPKVRHAYAQAGAYRVRLMTEDATRLSGVPRRSYDSLIVRVNTGPRAALKAVKDTYFAGKKIRFDASGSRSRDGNRLVYTWDFGDGEKITAGAKPTHAFKEAGDYTITVVADDNKDTRCSQDSASVKVKVGATLVAKAGEDIDRCADEPITFDGSQSLNINEGNVRYRWEFGNGKKAQGIKAVHAFRKPGVYPVTLKIKRADVRDIPESIDTRIVKINTKPVAKWKVPKEVPSGWPASFDATQSADGDNDPLTYIWNFGDGTIAKTTTPTTEHAYEKPGIYNTKLIIDDGRLTKCSMATQTKLITITASTPESEQP